MVNPVTTSTSQLTLPQAQDLLTRREVCQQYRMSLPWLSALGARGEGPTMLRLGKKKILYRRTDVEAWLEAHSTATQGA